MGARSTRSRKARHRRVRRRIVGTPDRPRLNVFRSADHIYAQIIDDSIGHTLASASSIEKDLSGILKAKTKTERASLVGRKIGDRALELKITKVVFDRGGYLYHGRIRALAEGARKAGLIF